ncbi:MAG: cytochrome c maturation protein CcmE [Microscillaceae bacterium]|nr:cytochrome c maturation protein CcmE [Microscillaceae bacterium]MDW8461954.1 cytochrome c maturation protein CcmE [Cytophagales bacterium]
MKVSYIIGIVVIALAIAIIISTTGDASQYVSFAEAQAMAQKGQTTKIHVVGELKRDAQGNIVDMEYNPIKNPNLFTFTLIDQKKQACKVVYRNPKPADFERSEQIVVVGNMQNNVFVAEKILMKCPSKYQDNKLEVKRVPAKP